MANVVSVSSMWIGSFSPSRASRAASRSVSTEDRTINPDLERFMAKRMGAKTIEVKASHLSLISQPDEITQLILEAAGLRAWGRGRRRVEVTRLSEQGARSSRAASPPQTFA